MKSTCVKEKIETLLLKNWKICEYYNILIPPKDSKYEKYCAIYEFHEDIWIPHYILRLDFLENLEREENV